MRIRLLTLAAVGAVALFVAVATAGAFSRSSYQWQQPASAPVTNPGAQPQLSFVPVALAGLRATSSSHYLWGQPGTAPVNTPDAQPW